MLKSTLDIILYSERNKNCVNHLIVIYQTYSEWIKENLIGRKKEVERMSFEVDVRR